MMKNEMKQKMMMCIVTLEKLTGQIPSVKELISALGKEYEGILMEYYKTNNPIAIA